VLLCFTHSNFKFVCIHKKGWKIGKTFLLFIMAMGQNATAGTASVPFTLLSMGTSAGPASPTA
jgi:hypothetical protein